MLTTDAAGTQDFGNLADGVLLNNATGKGPSPTMGSCRGFVRRAVGPMAASRGSTCSRRHVTGIPRKPCSSRRRCSECTRATTATRRFLVSPTTAWGGWMRRSRRWSKQPHCTKALAATTSLPWRCVTTGRVKWRRPVLATTKESSGGAGRSHCIPSYRWSATKQKRCWPVLLDRQESRETRPPREGGGAGKQSSQQVAAAASSPQSEALTGSTRSKR